jgi:hypothetical protein
MSFSLQAWPIFMPTSRPVTRGKPADHSLIAHFADFSDDTFLSPQTPRWSHPHPPLLLT